MAKEPVIPITLQLTDAQYRRLQRLAREAGVTIRTMCRRLIELAVKREKKKGG